MPAACKVGDTHSCGTIDNQGSPNVFINGSAAHRISDSDSHGGTQIEGSPNVLVNGLGLARIGDLNSGDPTPHPPSAQNSGSPNVFVN